jgi:outer membrane protein OmpA-like peptidoglycan-associated protein
MRKRTSALLVVLLVVAVASSTGCVSKKMFRKNVEENDTRMAAVETGVEANEKRIKDLRGETDDRIAELDAKAERANEVGRSAMSKAEQASQEAEQAARGRLIWEVTLSNDQVKFSFNQTTIPSDAAAVLDDLIKKILAYDKAVWIEIQGHTDSTGGEDYNYELGDKRASAVRDYMARGGIPLHAMNVISMGESSPVADNSTPDGRAQNRRVVIRVLE